MVAPRIDLHVFLHHEDRVLEAKLNSIADQLTAVLKEEVRMAGEFDALAEQVKVNTDVEASAKVLIEGFSARLDAAIAAAAAAGATPAQLAALVAEKTALDSSAVALAAAVAANTPAAPTTPA